MHNGFVRIDDEKMSKSLGNFRTVRDVLATLRDPEVLRFFLLSSHYRGPINYSAAQLAQADETLLGLYRALKDAGRGRENAASLAAFRAAMDDDFNTPEALAAIQGVARELGSAKARGDDAAAADAAATLCAMGRTLGLLQQDPDAYLKRGVAQPRAAAADGAAGDAGAQPRPAFTDAEIEALLAARHAARSARNFTESDRIRDQLRAGGILLEDKTGGGTQWRRA